MIRTAWPRDLPAIRALFAAANDGPYDLATVAEEKCFGVGARGAAVARVFEQEGRVAGVAVTCGKWLRILVVAREARRRGIGTALLTDAEAHGAGVVAAEPGNYFTPGLVTSDEGSIAFFRSRGYVETRWTWNLRAPLDGLPDSEPAIRPRHEDADRVLDFVEREFGRVWRFEASRAFHADVPRVFVCEQNGTVCGFAVHDVNNQGLGTFGPTGVAPSVRGRGIGRRLLLASLADLRALGYGSAIIPWTDAVDFYRRSCGAEPEHRFLAMARTERESALKR